MKYSNILMKMITYDYDYNIVIQYYHTLFNYNDSDRFNL